MARRFVAQILLAPLAHAHGFEEFPVVRMNLAGGTPLGTEKGMRDAMWEVLEYDPKSKRPKGAGKERCPSNIQGESFGNEPMSKFTKLTEIEAGSTIKVKLDFTTAHKGYHWWEYACFDGMYDKTANDAGAKWTPCSLFDGGAEVGKTACADGGKLRVGDSNICMIELNAPKASCKHGLLQWNWLDTDAEPGRTWKNCADVSVVGEGGGGGGFMNDNLKYIAPVAAVGAVVLLLAVGGLYYVCRKPRVSQENQNALE